MKNFVNIINQTIRTNALVGLGLSPSLARSMGSNPVFGNHFSKLSWPSWSKALDLRPNLARGVGSNPTESIFFNICAFMIRIIMQLYVSIFTSLSYLIDHDVPLTL